MAELAAKSQSIARRSVVMSSITVVSRLTGYLRVAVMAFALGATAVISFGGGRVGIGDSYNLSNIIPNIIFDLLVGGILYSVFVPIIVEKLAEGDDEEVWRVASSMINLAALATLAISVLGFVFAGPVIRFMTGSKPASDPALAIWLFRFFTWQIFFYGLCAVFTGILNAYRHFAAPMISPLANNVIVIATGFVFAFVAPNNLTLALYILGAGTTLGVVSMAAVQLPSLIKVGARYRPVLDLSHPSIRKLGRLAGPIFLYSMFGQISLWVTNRIAFGYIGGVTGFQYAWQFFQLPFGIFAVSIITAIFPELSEQASSGDMNSFKKTVSLGIRSLGIIMLPLSVLLIVFAQPLIQVALEYGKFDSKATLITSGMLFYFAFGVYFYAILMFVIRAFYALQDTMTPMKVNAAAVSVNIALNYILVYFMGVTGLALAQTLTFVFIMIVISYCLRKRIGPLGIKRILVSTTKYAVAVIPLGLVSFFLYGFIAANWEVGAGIGRMDKVVGALTKTGQLGIASLGGMAMYLLIMYLLKVEEISVIKRFANRLLSLVKS
ncbi:MAG: murein biosynthesis integral membrane protein MurJ [Candidatus Aquicultorales bacterium]